MSQTTNIIAIFPSGPVEPVPFLAAIAPLSNPMRFVIELLDPFREEPADPSACMSRWPDIAAYFDKAAEDGRECENRFRLAPWRLHGPVVLVENGGSLSITNVRAIERDLGIQFEISPEILANLQAEDAKRRKLLG